jgi:hypothetical protein
MPEMVTTQVTVPAVKAHLDLSAVRRFANGQHGQLVAIDYVHEEYLPDLVGPVLHFQIPDGRVLLTRPDEDGYDLIWKETGEVAVIDGDAFNVVADMWNEVNESFRELLKLFGRAAVETIAKAVITR